MKQIYAMFHGEQVFDECTQKWMEWDAITDGWWEVTPQPPKPRVVKQTDPVVEAVVTQFKQRSEVGIKKYGVTLARDDLSLADWVNHAIEEVMDLTLYLKRIQIELKRKKDDWK